MKEKKEIRISIDRELLKILESKTTSKSRVIEKLLYDYLKNKNIKLEGIIL